MLRDALIIIGSALLGGGGLVGLAIYYIRRYIDKKLKAEEDKEEERRQFRLKKAACEERMQHAESRWIFWVNRWIETGEHNGELKAAYEEFQEAERQKKDLEREIITRFGHE